MLLALDAEVVETQTKIRLRWKGDLIDLTLEHNTQDVMRATVRENVDRVIDTTVGRVILNERLTRDGLPFVNGTLKKKGLQSLVSYCHLRLGHEQTVALARRSEDDGLPLCDESRVCRSASTTWSRRRARRASSKGARKEVDKLQKQYEDATMTNMERENKVTAIWSEVTDESRKKCSRRCTPAKPNVRN